MHEIDTDGHVSNQFDEGDPGVPRNPTQVDPDWLNAVQNELVNAIETAGVTLAKGTNTQLARILGLLGSGTRAGVARYFSATLDILVGAAQALVLAGHPGGGDGLADIQNDVTGTRAKIASSTHAIDATGDIETDAEMAALSFQFDTASAPTSPPGSGTAGQVIWIGGAFNKLYCYDGSTWQALW